MTPLTLNDGRPESCSTHEYPNGTPLKGLPPQTIDRPLYRLVAKFLEDNCLLVCLTGEDRTGIIHHLSRLVTDFGLNIDESYGTRLQSKHGSFFLVSGPNDMLRLLAKTLKKGRHELLKGRVILPCKIYDMTVEGPDRVGLICDISTVLKDFHLNILTLRSFSYLKSEHGRSLDRESEWSGYIHIRFEAGEEQLDQLPRLKKEVHELLHRSSPSSRNQWDPPGSWQIGLEERRPDDPQKNEVMHFPSRN